MDIEKDGEWFPLMGEDIKMKGIINNKNNNTNTASMGTIVKCSYKGYFQDDTLPFEIANNILLKIGEGDVIPALELSLRHSHVGDTFRVKTTAKFAYGSGGRNCNNSNILSPSTVNINDHKDENNSKSSNGEISEVIVLKTIPPNMNLEYEVTVISFDDYTNNLLASINLRKEIGNRWYSYGEYSKAAYSYSKGIQQGDAFFQSIGTNFDINSYEYILFQSYISCLNNLAQCHINNSEYYKAKEVCTKLLSLDTNNIKGLLRAAKASLALHDYEECELCLKIVQNIDASNPSMINEMLKLKKAKKEYKVNSKALNTKIAKHLFVTNDNNQIKQTMTTHNNENISDKIGESVQNTSEVINTEEKNTKSAQGQNLLLMLTTSFVILLISVLIVFYTTYYIRN